MPCLSYTKTTLKKKKFLPEQWSEKDISEWGGKSTVNIKKKKKKQNSKRAKKYRLCQVRCFGHYCDPAKQVQLGWNSLLSPAEPREKKGEVSRKLTPGELVKGAVSPQNAEGSEKGSAQGQERHWRWKVSCARILQTGAATVLSRSCLPPPGLGPQSLTCGARAPSGSSRLGDSKPPGEEDRPTTSYFRARNPEATPTPQAKQRPFFPPEASARSRTGDVSESLGTITRSGEYGFLLPLAASSSLSVFFNPCRRSLREPTTS